MVAFKQPSFAAGEIAPSLYARADLTKYATGLRTCRNFVVARHGGVFNRPGTKFIAEVKDSTKDVRLIPFVFNNDQTYVLEFGHEYIRVYRNGAQVTEASQNITAITQAVPCYVTCAGHGLTNGDEVYISGVGGMTELNGRNFKVANAGTDDFSLRNMADTADIDSRSFGSYTSGGTLAKVYEVVTPYASTDLAELQTVQSADVVTIVHPTYHPKELKRTGHTSWTLSDITFAPIISAPANLSVTGTAGTNAHVYVVTAIAENTYEESLASTEDGGSFAGPSETNPIGLTWDAVTGAVEYNVYRGANGTFWWIGTAGTNAFDDTGYTQDFTKTPPVARDPFDTTDNFPGAVGYCQQRRIFGATNNSPETIWTSRTGLPANFTISSPIQDDDAITFTMAGRYVNEVRHILEVNRLVVLTSGGEWTVEGDSAGILRPTDINAKQQAYNGSAVLSPLIVNGTVVYLQARGSIVRDLGFDFSVDGYRGNDLTIFASHLVDSYTLADWSYQQIPHSVIWAIRSDGTLLGLTYIREHEIVAWHRHDTDGTFKNVVSIPEGTQDAVYVVVEREIDGATVRYVERMLTQRKDDIVDETYLDCHLSYDGRHTGTTTMTLSGGSTWEYDETITLTASASTFASSDIGNAVHLTGSDGTIIRFSIEGYTSGTVVTGRPHKTIPAAMQSVAITTWAMAVDQVGGLWHLEGKTVGVFGDGFVVASPNNEAYVERTVSNGTVTLDRPYSVIHVGLPVTSDLETLDIEIAEGGTLANKKKNVSSVTMFVESSRGIWVGNAAPTGDDPLDGLVEMKLRDDEAYDAPTDLETGTIDVNIRPEWNSNGRICVRQVDPLPLSVLAVVPTGMIPVRG